MRNKKELLKRYTFFIIGICFNAVGVAFITKSMLGTGPTTAIPYVFSKIYFISFGKCNFIFNMLLLIIQILILRKDFKKQQLLQIPVSFLYSYFIDLAMLLLSDIKLNMYIAALSLTVAGCILRAFGVSCQVLANVVMLSPEAFVKSISDVSKKEFSICKIISDVLMTSIALIMSLIFTSSLSDIREGTLITSVIVGPISHFFTKKMGFTTHYFENEGKLVYETKFKLKEGHRLVITITSESGSGGRVIARNLGIKLGVPVYDRELIDMIAEEGGYSKKYVEKHEEKLFSNPFEEFFYKNYNYTENELEGLRSLFTAQSTVIKKLYSAEDCIIIGHCSNYILEDAPGTIHFHIGSDSISRIKYMMEHYSMNEHEAHNQIIRRDIDTAKYYKYFTGKDWKDSSGYDVTIDSSLFGYEGTAEVIEQIIKKNYINIDRTIE